MHRSGLTQQTELYTPSKKAGKNRPSTSIQLKHEQSELELQNIMQVTKAEYGSNLIQEFAFSKNDKIYEYIHSCRKEDSAFYND